MMTKTRSSQGASLKYLAALPAVAVLLMAFSFQSKPPTAPSASTAPLPTVQVEQPEAASAFSASADTVPVAKGGEQVFQFVEEMPRFPGCEEVSDADERSRCTQTKMMEFIFSHVKFPAEAIANGIQGKVVASFVVEKDGTLSDPKILKPLGGGCDEEVLKMLAAMPKWIPGQNGGKPVRTQFALPVQFRFDPEVPAPASEPMNSKDLDEMPVWACCEGFSGDARKNCADQSMMTHIFEHLKYPAEAREKGAEGMVVAKFTIEKDGRVTNPKVTKSVGFGCDEEVLRVIGLMPNWSPGIKDGQPVAALFTLPVKFKLDADEKKFEVFEVFPNPAGEAGFNVKFKAAAGPVSIFCWDASKKGDPVERLFMTYDGTEQTVHFSTDGLFPGGVSQGTLVVSLLGENQTVLGTKAVVVVAR